MMRIEMLEKVMHERDVYEKGDTRTVSDELGMHFCGMGWAKDVDGTIETGARNINAVTLTPDNVVNATVAGEANG